MEKRSRGLGSTCEDDDVDVVLGALKLIGDSQVAVNIFLSQPRQFPGKGKKAILKDKN